MTELQRDLHVLVAIAKLDAELNSHRTELGLLPDKVSQSKKKLEEIIAAEKDAAAHLDEMAKERRTLEQKLDDNAVQIKKYKVQLMEVKTNKEYTAMLHEIEHLEKDTEAKEERLLILMDELDQQKSQHEQAMEQSASIKKEWQQEQAQLEARINTLSADSEKLDGEKPKLLHELDASLKKRYDRILVKLGDFAVTHVVDDICQGCFTRIPPQTAVEVRQNNRIITCEVCGRILVYYNV